jgi:hypothetical protein
MKIAILGRAALDARDDASSAPEDRPLWLDQDAETASPRSSNGHKGFP